VDIGAIGVLNGIALIALLPSTARRKKHNDQPISYMGGRENICAATGISV
jgi:hypothetical protein